MWPNPRSEFGSGERNRLNPGSAGSKFGVGIGRTLVRHCPFSQLRTCHGACLSLNSKPAEPGFGPVLSPNCKNVQEFRVWRKELGFLRKLNLRNQGSALSILRTPNLPGFCVRRKELAFLGTPNLSNQVWHGPFSNFRTCQSSEFGESNGPFSKL